MTAYLAGGPQEKGGPGLAVLSCGEMSKQYDYLKGLVQF